MKKNVDFYAVILAGGSGERFWPLSTSERPKQFLKVFGGRSLIRQAVERLRGLVPVERTIVITAESLASTTRRELPELPRSNVIGEPCRRDTAAAVATACGVVARLGGDNAVCAILTADQLMTDVSAFRRVLADSAIAAARTDSIVTMGVKPDYPATGFGYIERGPREAMPTKTVFCRARRFVEKPDLATAKRYLAGKRHVWNAGMFVWRVATMRAALVSGAPALAILEATIAGCRTPVKKILSAYYPALPRISVDYAVMEKADNILVAEGDFGWDDVGTWNAADRHMQTDGRRNAVRGDVTLLDVSDSTAIAAEGAPRIAALGVSGVVVVATRDAVLVASRDRVQDLKQLIARMAAGHKA